MTDPEGWPGDWSGRIRAAARAVIRHDDRILCIAAREPGVDLDFFFLPGGGMRFGESSVDTVRREVLEELGIEVSRMRLLGVLENRFTWVGEPYHSIETVYEVLETTPPIATLGRRVDVAGPDHDARWQPLACFDPTRRPLYPDGVLELLAGSSGEPT